MRIICSAVVMLTMYFWSSLIFPCNSGAFPIVKYSFHPAPPTLNTSKVTQNTPFDLPSRVEADSKHITQHCLLPLTLKIVTMHLGHGITIILPPPILVSGWTEVPPEFLKSWHFHQRTALLPRAPTAV